MNDGKGINFIDLVKNMENEEFLKKLAYTHHLLPTHHWCDVHGKSQIRNYQFKLGMSLSYIFEYTNGTFMGVEC